MKEIKLTQGQVALVDDEDYEWINQWKWHAQRSGDGFYACRTETKNGKHKLISMHRLIAETPHLLITDHINGNTLDNRRANLRPCDYRQNMYNSIGKVKTSVAGYKGVDISTNPRLKKKYRATIFVNGRHVFLGCFYTPKEAAMAYDKAAVKYFGDFARLNKFD